MQRKIFTLFLPVVFTAFIAFWPQTSMALDEKAVQPAMKAGTEKAVSSTISGTESGSTNINTATAEELAKLPGIGPKTAEEIVKFRKEHGAFKAKRDIINVKGVGEKKFQALQDKITVGQEEGSTGGVTEQPEKAAKGKAKKELAQ